MISSSHCRLRSGCSPSHRRMRRACRPFQKIVLAEESGCRKSTGDSLCCSSLAGDARWWPWFWRVFGLANVASSLNVIGSGSEVRYRSGVSGRERTWSGVVRDWAGDGRFFSLWWLYLGFFRSACVDRRGFSAKFLGSWLFSFPCRMNSPLVSVNP
jgi:hypothetical protein